jgi:hypothetical protein
VLQVRKSHDHQILKRTRCESNRHWAQTVLLSETPKGVRGEERDVHLGMTRVEPCGDFAAVSRKISRREEKQSTRFQDSVDGVKGRVGILDVFEYLNGDNDVVQLGHIVQTAPHSDAVRRREFEAIPFFV